MRRQYDTIVIGTGVAGLFCTLNLNSNQKVLLITKDSLEKSNSYLAQGGVAVLKNFNDYPIYLEDTLKAGKYRNKIKSVEVMIKSSTEVIYDLIKMGVDFDKEDGMKDEFSFTKEAAHSTNRILHHKDITGREITKKLLSKVKLKKNVTIKTYCELIDLLITHNTCSGVVLKDQEEIYTVFAQNIVLATGGVGGLFKNSTNFRHITGDALTIASRYHIALKDMQYIQFHPTALYTKNHERKFLISEAVRGEGGYLLNSSKSRFVNELLPRDTVTKAILNELKKSNQEYVYLAVSHLGEEKIKTRFPNIYKKCLEQGYDITKELVPVIPAQHYFMGGIKIDTLGRTSVKNLFAVGETACNGVHGANRLASNSLLESLVFSKRAAGDINIKVNYQHQIAMGG